MEVTMQITEEAHKFITQYYHETGKSLDGLKNRWKEIDDQIHATGAYQHTYDELVYGAKVAWRNSNRCIGRLFWERMEVIDARDAESSEDVFQYLFNHIKTATNNGKVKPLITIFRPETNNQKKVKIWNHQLLRYAGYRTEEGVTGDPDSADFTEQCLQLGWKGKGTAFDLLPLVVQIDNNPPEFRNIPASITTEISIEHRDFPAISELNLKWYSVPIISDMRLEIGGINYVTAPFNGWYMGTEIGARNLADEKRYNLLPAFAEKMGLDTKRESSLWRDRALVEMNAAVLDSFKKYGVTIVDHHTAAKQFQAFEEQEEKAGRDVTGKWSWLIPPLSPATTHMWHKPYNNTVQKPNYFYQDNYYTVTPEE
ncbi:nitric oxide synthase oxygenase [Oceanobacillus massiliensis]|uniref:nitric oxide synthase oxygenase n=1 Tax=Oceanobacillus massiliensis TaxID=1465765 RepID=UPI000288D20F|nr:nitric oxide synthase oxygenase [Oceanobacillus massiliensis]